MPELVVSRMTKRLRPGKVLVDWSQNDAHKTTVDRLLGARARAPDRVDAGELGRGRSAAASSATSACSRSRSMRC